MKKIILTIAFSILTISTVSAMTFNEAKSQTKPVVVMFHMKGCSACKQFSPMFDKISSKYKNKFNFVKEDIDNSDIAKTLNFMTVPAIFIIDPQTMHAKRVDDNCAWDKACFANTLTKY